MERMLINATRDEKRVALVQENVLFDFITERPGFEQKIGNIYLARITSIEPSLDAVFVEFGSERHGFLPLKEISRQYFSHKAEQYDRPGIRDLLRVGQELLIQVEKEERGNKGAALTTYISLAGSYLVLMPNSPRAGGISRRIEGDERDQLREILAQVTIPEGMGLIVRTAAIGRTNDELKWDLDVLLSHWRNIEEASKSRSAPALIHAEGNVVVRAIRDYVRQDTAEIIIDDETEYQNAKHYLEQIRPDIADRVKLYADTTPLFSRYGIEHQIETAYKRAIDLPSGASIVIDYTEALVSIDVNSARATKGGSIETTAFNTNIEAAEEIARQLRLRDIGGLIVIDFIDMLETKHQFEVEKHLTNALKYDRARIQIQRISRFGLLEMSRQRLRPSLRDSHQHVCPTCSGHGTIRSVETVALTLVRIIEEEALKPQTAEVVVQASTEASTYLLNEKRHLLAAIEKNHGVKVSVIPNPNLQSSNHTKKRIRLSDTDEGGRSSSDRLQEPTVEINLPSSSERPPAHKPAVRQMIPTRPDKAAASGGLFKRIWDTMFGQEEDVVETSPEETFQQKPTYSPRAPTRGGQRPPRRPRADEGTDTRDSRDSRDSRDRSTDSRERSGAGRRYGDSNRTSDRSDERSGQRSGDSRQRSSGPRQQRSGGRNAPATKATSGSKSTQYTENPNEDHYNEYSQKVDHNATTSRTKTPSVTEHALKPTQIDKMAEEAPITIKASTSSSHAPTSRSTPSTTSPASSSTSSAPAGSASDRPVSSSPNSSSQRLASTTSYAPRSGSSTSVSPMQQRSTASYSPSATPSAAGLGSGGLASTSHASGSLSGGATSATQSAGASSGGTASVSQTSGTSPGSTTSAPQTPGTSSGSIASAGQTTGTTASSIAASTSGGRQSSSYSAPVSQTSGSTASGNMQVSTSGATQASGTTSGNIDKVGSPSGGTQTSANISGGSHTSGSTSASTAASGSAASSSPTSSSSSASSPISGSSSSTSGAVNAPGSASSSNQGTNSSSSSSAIEDNQKPLIVRASTQEDKPTSTSSISPDKKDKENTDA